MKDLLPTGGLLNIYGPPKGGKSYGALQMAYDIAGDSDNWLGFPILQHGPVLYCQFDTPRSLWQARILNDFLANGLDGSRVMIADREIAPFPFDILRPEQGATWLYEKCKEIKPLVVFIDVLRELSRANENDSGEMMAVINTLVNMVDPAAAVLVSHSKKDNMSLPAGERDNLMHDNRGSSYVAGRMDGVVKITRKTLHYQSRTCEEGRIKIKRNKETHLWMIDRSEFDMLMDIVLMDDTLESVNAKAKVLAERSGKSEDACRSALRRKIDEE